MTDRRFTGWHMFGVLVAMFGVITAANLVMGWYAVATFGGTVVDNSYVATREYNRWLAEAAAQERLGWQLATTIEVDRMVRVTVRGKGGLIDGQVSAIASHPLGRAPDRAIAFAPTSRGNYLTTRALPPGRWMLKITVTNGRNVAYFVRDVRL